MPVTVNTSPAPIVNEQVTSVMAFYCSPVAAWVN
jgi:hypothetical protein